MATHEAAEAVKGARWVALTNGHYHSEREWFLSLADRLITFTVLLAGASTVVAAMDRRMTSAAAIAVTAFAFVQLVFAVGPSARRHATLKEKYFAIAADLELGKMNPSEAQARMYALAGEESPIYAAAHALSQNWATGAVYGSSSSNKLCKVHWFRRVTRNVLRHASHDFHGTASAE